MIAAHVLEGAQDGRSAADVMEAGPWALAADDVMQGPRGMLRTSRGRGDRYRPRAVILARRLDRGEECAGY
jgi:hypothetical protein